MEPLKPSRINSSDNAGWLRRLVRCPSNYHLMVIAWALSTVAWITLACSWWQARQIASDWQAAYWRDTTKLQQELQELKHQSQPLSNGVSSRAASLLDLSATRAITDKPRYWLRAADSDSARERQSTGSRSNPPSAYDGNPYRSYARTPNVESSATGDLKPSPAKRTDSANAGWLQRLVRPHVMSCTLDDVSTEIKRFMDGTHPVLSETLSKALSGRKVPHDS